MTAEYLWIAGSLIFLLLGFAHLRITFWGKKLYPKSEATEASMKDTHPRLTRDTTMWKTWIGFNASHSAGAIFFGACNLIIGWQYVRESAPLLILNLVFVIFFLFLGRMYWFRIPLIGILLALICFIGAILIDKL
jgi:hypothetical protein